MRPEAQPWIRQAEADLQAAHDSLDAGHYEWACFQAQQAAEKSLKAFLYHRGYAQRLITMMRHSLYGPGSVLEACEQLEPDFSVIRNEADLLNQYSIITRYPDSFSLAPGMAPTDVFDGEQAQRCIDSAAVVLSVVRQHVDD